MLAVLLAACATQPVAPDAAAPVPAARVHWANVDGGYTIRVTRDTGYVGSLCATRLYLNGAPAADMERGETVEFRVGAGRNILGAGPSPIEGKLCTAGGAVDGMRREIDASGKAGDALKFRVSIGGGVILTPTAF